MNSELIKFFSVQRQIFGVCSCCGDIFRLSDAKVYLKEKPQPDWMDRLQKSDERLDKQEDKINTEEAQTREIAREKGRKAAMESTKKIDTIFTPNNYNADDAKVMFHPVDFLIFNGMKEKNNIDNLVLFDREVKEAAQKALQKSVEKTVEKENYEWITMQVSEDGSVEYK
jgi:predicted Holliday junction resolvase-like endonuclease